MKLLTLAIGITLAASSAASATDDNSYASYASYASTEEISAFMKQDGPVTKCLVKARNAYAACVANAGSDKAKNACLKTLQKKVISCQNAK